MDARGVRRYCESRAGAEASYPFGPGARVYKADGRIFAIVADDAPHRVSLKCDPALAETLRSRYPSVTPGYHLNKRHWNTILLDGGVPSDELRSLIDHSHELIVGARRARRTR